MQRLTRLIGLSIILVAALLVVVLGSMLAGRYYYGSLARSPSPSVPAESGVPRMHPQVAERSTASAMPTDETTTLEETTAFQPAEGTRTASTARIVCLRAEQGASSAPIATEAPNGDALTRVLTPRVAAQADGVHYRIDNRLGQATNYSLRNEEGYTGEEGGSAEVGISKDVSELPPGDFQIQCDPTGTSAYTIPAYAHFEVVAAESGYESTELECDPDASPVWSVASDMGGYTGSHPEARARELFSERLEEGDVVEEAGYPEGPDPRPVRVVRDSKVVAMVDYEADGYTEYHCEGQF